ncbi:hypothetical protein LINGRAHAP2_LOCUS23845, partial [Linum grandiflorum]
RRRLVSSGNDDWSDFRRALGIKIVDIGGYGSRLLISFLIQFLRQ